MNVWLRAGIKYGFLAGGLLGGLFSFCVYIAGTQYFNQRDLLNIAVGWFAIILAVGLFVGTALGYLWRFIIPGSDMRDSKSTRP